MKPLSLRMLAVCAVLMSVLSCGPTRPDRTEGDTFIKVEQPSSAQTDDSKSGAIPLQPVGAGAVPVNGPVPQQDPNQTQTGAAPQMTLDEAKAKCAGCHQPSGMGARVWAAANGTEADWKAFASAAKSSVVAGRMPIGSPLTSDEKARMVAFLDRLLGPTANPPAGFTFETARLLCVGCHGSSGGMRMEPVLETRAQWIEEKSEIIKEIKRGRMPMNKNLTAKERQDLLNFVSTLGTL